MCPRAFSVPALYRPIDGEGRNQCESGIRQRGGKALLIGESARASVAIRSADGESLEEIVLFLLPRVEAHPANHFRLVRGVVGENAFAIKCADPVLHDAAGDVSANHGARAAEGCSYRRV